MAGARPMMVLGMEKKFLFKKWIKEILFFLTRAVLPTISFPERGLTVLYTLTEKISGAK